MGHIDELYNGIMTDALYYAPGYNGQHQWFPSSDITNDMIVGVLAEHDFLERVVKSSDLPFTIKKSFDGVTVGKTSALAKRFNALPFEGSEPPRYEVSEFSKVFRKVWVDLHLASVQFTGNPLSGITSDGLLEGELVNTFTLRLREAANKKSVKDAVDQRKRLTLQSVNDFKRYIARLAENNPCLQAVRVDFGFGPEYAKSILPQEAWGLVQKLIDVFEYDCDIRLDGFWFKREFLSEIGCRYHFVIAYRGYPYSGAEIPLLQAITNHWKVITASRGTFLSHAYDPQNCRSIGVGSVYDPNILFRAIKLMIDRDVFLRLTPIKFVPDYGMGLLPKKTKSLLLPLAHTATAYRPGLL